MSRSPRIVVVRCSLEVRSFSIASKKCLRDLTDRSIQLAYASEAAQMKPAQTTLSS